MEMNWRQAQKQRFINPLDKQPLDSGAQHFVLPHRVGRRTRTGCCFPHDLHSWTGLNPPLLCTKRSILNAWCLWGHGNCKWEMSRETRTTLESGGVQKRTGGIEIEIGPKLGKARMKKMLVLSRPMVKNNCLCSSRKLQRDPGSR